MGAVHYHHGKFPPERIDWERLIPLVGPSSAAVARFDGLLRAMPNPDVLLSPLTTMGEVLEYEAGRKAVHDARRDEYYDRLLAVSRDDDWTGWCIFFLEAVRVQAEDNLARASSIMRLYEEMRVRLPELTRSPHVIRALDWVFETPVFSASDFVRRVGVSEPAARRLLNVLRIAGIVSEIEAAMGSRPAVYVFDDLLDLADGE